MRIYVTENKTLPIFPSWTSCVGASLLEPFVWEGVEVVEHETFGFAVITDRISPIMQA
jgi:hypothetical protein